MLILSKAERIDKMPEISRFYGIIIKMFLNLKNMNPAIFMLYMENMWEFLICKTWK